MFGFLNIDGPFFKLLTKITNYLILAVTYVVCCIPIITVGAASTAMYITHHKVIENGEGYVWQTYWQQFRSNFKQATVLWLIMLLLTAILAADIFFAYMLSNVNAATRFVFILAIILCVLFITWMRYWFPYIAHVEDPIRRVLKNTLIMTIIHLPQSICIALIYALCVVPLFFFLNPAIIVLAPAVYSWLSYKPLTKVFVHYWDMSDGYTGEETEEE